LELLCTDDYDRAAILAKQLQHYNVDRKREEEGIMEEALRQAEADLNEPALVLLGEGWNQGIIGIVASRLVDIHHKPVIIFCKDRKSLKGSGRSIKGFDLHRGIGACEEFLDSFGGHAMAAGIRLTPEKFPLFKQRFLEIVRQELGDVPLQAVLTLDGDLNFAAASDFTLLKELELLQPFGIGNPEPVFSSPALLVKGRRLFGPQRNHVNLELLDESTDVTLHAKAWRQAEQLPHDMEGKRIRLAYSPAIDMYSGVAGVDVKIKDIQILD
jgi:single-stranded-DNA-specific exonuclease